MQSAAAVGMASAMTSAFASAVAAAPKSGGTLRLGADGGGATDTLNPLQLLGADHTQNAAFCGYDTLTEMDSNGQPQPSLAESWEGNPDGTWAIRLRKGVEFHDGKTLTAEDVVWSLQQHNSETNKNG